VVAPVPEVEEAVVWPPPVPVTTVEPQAARRAMGRRAEARREG
jgi:hypothetical protein